MDREALAEYRYRAVLEVLSGSPVGEVVARYGASRQSVHAWRKRFEQEGVRDCWIALGVRTAVRIG